MTATAATATTAARASRTTARTSRALRGRVRDPGAAGDDGLLDDGLPGVRPGDGTGALAVAMAAG
ncbi:hypothetical protein GCM10009737_15350 [Nocardioides lentus]|uniref:Uncharacterized protein n=1 Tax=Nocardioides lentus TaxID=338077 RepID=A0ABN2P9N7_9ACTN